MALEVINSFCIDSTDKINVDCREKSTSRVERKKIYLCRARSSILCSCDEKYENWGKKVRWLIKKVTSSILNCKSIRKLV